MKSIILALFCVLACVNASVINSQYGNFTLPDDVQKLHTGCQIATREFAVNSRSNALIVGSTCDSISTLHAVDLVSGKLMSSANISNCVISHLDFQHNSEYLLVRCAATRLSSYFFNPYTYEFVLEQTLSFPMIHYTTYYVSPILNVEANAFFYVIAAHFGPSLKPTLTKYSLKALVKGFDAMVDATPYELNSAQFSADGQYFVTFDGTHVVRHNVAKDVVTRGQGFPASSFLFDGADIGYIGSQSSAQIDTVFNFATFAAGVKFAPLAIGAENACISASIGSCEIIAGNNEGKFVAQAMVRPPTENEAPKFLDSASFDFPFSTVKAASNWKSVFAFANSDPLGHFYEVHINCQ